MTRATDSLADWFVGGAGKRRLLSALTSATPGDRFTQKELADAAHLHEKGSVVRHLQVLERAGVLEREGPGRAYVIRDWPYRETLSRWLDDLRAVEGLDASWREPLPRFRGEQGT